MYRKHSKSRRFETLEKRAMLAGDIFAVYDAGTETLTLTGDGLDNSFTFIGDGIGGYDLQGTNGTTISGAGAGLYDVINFNVENLIVNLGAGNDIADISVPVVTDAAASALTSLTIDMGDGQDAVLLGNAAGFTPGDVAGNSAMYALLLDPMTSGTVPSLSVTGTITIEGGAGADKFELINVNGNADWTINGGDATGTAEEENANDATIVTIEDNDIAGAGVINDQSYVFVGYAGVATFDGGSGNDVVNSVYMQTSGALTVNGGAGQDLISLFGSAIEADSSLNGGADADLIVVDFSQSNTAGITLTVDGGDGGDFVRVARSLFVDSTLTVNGGAGSDLILIGLYSPANDGNYVTGGNEAGTINVNGGDDGDAVDVRANSVVDFFADLGAGDDDLDLLYNLADTATLDGGEGFDAITAIGNDAGSFSNVGFENENDIFAAYA